MVHIRVRIGAHCQIAKGRFVDYLSICRLSLQMGGPVAAKSWCATRGKHVAKHEQTLTGTLAYTEHNRACTQIEAFERPAPGLAAARQTLASDGSRTAKGGTVEPAEFTTLFLAHGLPARRAIARHSPVSTRKAFFE